MTCREYGEAPYKVAVIHGGPGAPGSCVGICQGLSDKFGVLEILQSKNSINELVEEMYNIILHYDIKQIALVGHSWGAWLSFIFASKYPEHVSKLILVGSGLFDVKYYPQLIEASKAKSMTIVQKEDVQAANLYSPNMEYSPYGYCLLSDIPDNELPFDEVQFQSIISEIIPMRDSGELLNCSEKIKCPVVAIHGKNDPHIVDGIKKPLESRLSDFKMYVLEKCGHDPWKEYYAKGLFFEKLRKELIL